MDPTEVVRAALRALDAPGGSGFADHFADDGELVSPLGTAAGRDAIGEFVGGMHGSFTDWDHDVTIAAAAGAVVVVEGTWNGTQTGPMPTPQGELPPTGKRLTVPFAGIVRLRDGRIESVHNYFDQLTFMAQLGLMPEPEPAAA